MMSYYVGKDDNSTVLKVGDDGFTTTMTMTEGAVVQLIKLLGATLEKHTVEVYSQINIEEEDYNERTN